MRVLVVGMNPSARSPKKPNATFRKLNGWMPECGVAYYSFCNTFDDISSAEKSKVDFNRLIELSCDYSKIIALGNFVSDALNTISVPEHGANDCMTTLTYEEPCDYKENSYERYYPIKDKDGDA